MRQQTGADLNEWVIGRSLQKKSNVMSGFFKLNHTYSAQNRLNKCCCIYLIWFHYFVLWFRPWEQVFTVELTFPWRLLFDNCAPTSKLFNQDVLQLKLIGTSSLKDVLLPNKFYCVACLQLLRFQAIKLLSADEMMIKKYPAVFNNHDRVSVTLFIVKNLFSSHVSVQK